ncbi:MAG: hypothetical protein EOP56_09165 [Sphingobacteriales bacterium]|nr:MAG: hypothetical protein EOP56_09165 [Sphingobacteriales bacterium]
MSVQIITLESPALFQLIADAKKEGYLKGREEAGIIQPDPEQWVTFYEIEEEQYGMVCVRTLMNYSKSMHNLNVKPVENGRHAIQRKDIPRLLLFIKRKGK